MKNRDFTFDPVQHVYKLDGRRLTSVTEILSIAGFFGEYPDTPQVKYKQDLGKRVHLATALYDLDDLGDVGSEDAVSYLESWIQFRKDNPQMEIDQTRIEMSMFSPTLYYAMTLDRVVKWDGDITVLDLKTGVPHPATRLQLAAYQDGYNEYVRVKDKQAVRRMVVYLKQKGKAVPDLIDTKTNREDSMTFKACIQVVNFKRKYKA